MKRERKTDSGTALEITMSSPQSLYLRGFVGDMYTGEAWEALPASVYYNAQNLMYWLEEKWLPGAGADRAGGSADRGDRGEKMRFR